MKKEWGKWDKIKALGIFFNGLAMLIQAILRVILKREQRTVNRMLRSEPRESIYDILDSDYCYSRK